ncbi:MAG: hypothetical protein ABF759_03335, partial [Acetobacter malorum]|uniref:hypothetical protein n=1 Tax=Acetobacter malorum TaxID=178901 RepID=UPI0039E9B264
SFCSDRSVMNRTHHHTIKSTRRLTPEAYHHFHVMMFHTRRRSVSELYLVFRISQALWFGPDSILTASSLMRLFLLPSFRSKWLRIELSHIFAFARREGTLPQFSTPRNRDKFYFRYYSTSWSDFFDKKMLTIVS